MSPLRESKTDLFVALATLALASFVLALFAFARPLFRTVFDDISYQQTGTFSYSAAAPPGIYDTDTVQTGEPVFRRLITLVNVNFDYRLLADLPGDLRGTCRLVAELAASNGWRWTVELQPETAFSGSSFTASSVIDLSQVQTLLNSLEQQTGISQQQYTLAVVPKVIVSGTLAGQELRDEFSPRLVFALDELQMRLAPDRDRTADSGDPLKPVQTGLLRRAREEPNTISLLGLNLAVSTARQLSVIGLGLFLASTAGLGLSMLRVGRGGEASRIQAKYGSLLVAVRDSNLEAGGRVIQVATIDDLAKIAERNGHMILHQGRGSAHCYFVQDKDVTYRYQVAGDDDSPSAQGKGGTR